MTVVVILNKVKDLEFPGGYKRDSSAILLIPRPQAVGDLVAI